MSNISTVLTQKGWALPVLATLSQGGIAGVYPLAKALKTSPISIEAALAHLVELKFAETNPGHGHPLRPEFVLTPLGEMMGPKASEILKYGETLGILSLLRKRWVLPIVAALDNTKTFGGLRQSLSPVTDRALSLSLKDLTQARLVHRKVQGHQFPPTTLYMPTQNLKIIREPLSSGLINFILSTRAGLRPG